MPDLRAVKSAAFFLLGLITAYSPTDQRLAYALQGYEASNAELRAASATMRGMCLGPRVQPAIQGV